MRPGVPRSARFGDVYYSAEDGLADGRLDRWPVVFALLTPLIALLSPPLPALGLFLKLLVHHGTMVIGQHRFDVVVELAAVGSLRGQVTRVLPRRAHRVAVAAR